MDSLALLCNLHADGPATLSRLRRGGCRSLADLERLGPESVAEMLQVPPAMARRLTKEARLLLDRVGELPLDPEEAPAGLAVPFAPAADGTPGIAQEVARLAGGMPMPEPAATPIAESVSPVEAPPEVPIADQPRSGFRTHPGEASSVEKPAFQKPVSSLRQAPLVGEPLQRVVPGGDLIGAVDGLDSIVAQALAGAGVSELKDLVDWDPGQLARQTGIHFSGIRRLQFLARRALTEPEPKSDYAPEPIPPRKQVAAPEVASGESQVETLAETSQREASRLPTTKGETSAAAAAPVSEPPAASPMDFKAIDNTIEESAPQHGEVDEEVADLPIEAPVSETLLTPALPVRPEQEAVEQATAKFAAKFTFADDAKPAEEAVEATQEEPVGETLPDHPVAEFEPQSGGPMVQENIRDPREVPLGRWLPKSQRSQTPEPNKEEPKAEEAPEPVLVPPPPPRRFWEPKRLWEARKNRRERAALKSRAETENLPSQQAQKSLGATHRSVETPVPEVSLTPQQSSPQAPAEVAKSPEGVPQPAARSGEHAKALLRHGPIIPGSLRPDLEPAARSTAASEPSSAAGQVEVEPLEPADLEQAQALAPARMGQNQGGALRWNFAEPSIDGGGAIDRNEAKKEGRVGFEFTEPDASSTREDASGPFA